MSETALILRPDWAAGVKVSRRYRTTVTGALSGKEMRSGLKDRFIRTLGYDAKALGAYQANYMKWALWKYLHTVVPVPWWVDEAIVIEEAAAGQNEIRIDSTAYTEFAEGGEIILLSDDQDAMIYEIGEIAGISIDEGHDLVTLSENLLTTWPAGSPVYPLFRFSIELMQEMSNLTSAIAEMRVEAVEAYEP